MPGFRPLAIRWHGRGGQGAKTAASLLAELVIDHQGYAQASPEFGPERRGAPVAAYTRISPAPITRRGPIEEPDVIIVLDRRLLAGAATIAGATTRTTLLVNAPTGAPPIAVGAACLIALDASGIARASMGRDIPNVPMLAAAAVLLTPLEPEAILAWLRRRLAQDFREEIVAGNLEAARAAIKEVGDGRALAVAAS